MKKIKIVGAVCLLTLLLVGCSMLNLDGKQKKCQRKTNDKVEKLLSQMTMSEKIGQLVQYSGVDAITGPQGENINIEDAIRKGKVSSLLNVVGAEETKRLQKIAVEESRLGIPLIFGLDVVHGYKTIFPVPLAMASSWNVDAVELAARTAAEEASAAGLHWTFAPMVDIARDPRWGRIVEGAGEDPYLGSCIAAAQVKGFQRDSLSEDAAIVACAKHYVGYGDVQAGRDYNNADITERQLWEIYLPPFQAAINTGVGTVMSAFNDVNGIPMTGNKELLKNVLKDQLHFNGFVVSDWNSIDEMIPHGYAKNQMEAGRLAMNAGLDMDMVSGIYSKYLPELLVKQQVTKDEIDDAVRRILQVKLDIGLFDNPYKYCNPEKEKSVILSKANRDAAKSVAEKCAVLLENKNSLLPLSKDIKTIALVGPLADDKDDMIGPWSAKGEGKDSISIKEGIQSKLAEGLKLLYAKGCAVNDDKIDGFAEAVNIAKQADIVIAVMGESLDMSGEAHSRADIGLPGVQQKLLKALKATGKPIVLVLVNGRPLLLNWEKENIPAILESWFLGTEAGNAVADILFGDYNPSGKLTVSFPYAVGQIPIYYNHRRSGRPDMGGKNHFVSKYLDIPNQPLYPFGYGLSYSTFKYSDVKLNKENVFQSEPIVASVEVTNTGKVAGVETVQVYIEDMYASVAQPVKKLVDFRQIEFKPGETKSVEFTIAPEKLMFFNQDMKKVIEPGQFKLYIGTNSADVKTAEFTVK